MYKKKALVCNAAEYNKDVKSFTPGDWRAVAGVARPSSDWVSQFSSACYWGDIDWFRLYLIFFPVIEMVVVNDGDEHAKTPLLVTKNFRRHRCHFVSYRPLSGRQRVL